MKKPNLTEGEWKLVEDGDFYLVNSDNEEAIHDSFHKANAKAISAVPDMIDALIGAKEALEGAKQDYSNRQLRSHKVNNSLNKVEKALKKAGVTEL